MDSSKMIDNFSEIYNFNWRTMYPMQDWHVATFQECQNPKPQHEVLYNIDVCEMR
jgi:hypothetical protein